MRSGLKAVRRRRDDALSRIGWDRLEGMLAEHYRRAGYAVEHVGTGASGRRFDGGIDLKLRKDDAYILVQSKHWNVYQVTHNAVHELLGVMVNQGATGAILVTSGEFTRAAVEAATRQGHVQLIDGDALRAMLGPLPDAEIPVSPQHRAAAARVPSAGTGLRAALASGLWLVVVKLAVGLAVLWFMSGAIRQALVPVAALRPQAMQAPAPAPVPEPSAATVDSTARADASVLPAAVEPAPPDAPPTPDAVRESQRQADEAMQVIEANTPEM